MSDYSGFILKRNRHQIIYKSLLQCYSECNTDVDLLDLTFVSVQWCNGFNGVDKHGLARGHESIVNIFQHIDLCNNK